MNEDTLWLQVPAAIRQPPGFTGLATYGGRQADKPEPTANSLTSRQNSENIAIKKTTIILFVADHGVILEKKINTIQPVSEKLLSTFSVASDTRCSINKIVNTQLEVINLGTKIKSENIEGIINSKIASSTANFCHSPAMNNEQLAQAINTGRQSAQRIKLSGTQLFVAREINHANTLSALAMTYALLDIKPDTLSEVDAEKKSMIQQALIKHKTKLTSPLEILRCLGSFEIAALTGSYLCCAHMGLPVLIDGFSGAVAALVTSKLCPDAEQWFLYKTAPDTAAHKQLFKKLNAQALLPTQYCTDSIAGVVQALSLLQLACNNNEISDFIKEEKLLKIYS